jgi:hypothetical protein
LGEVGQIDQTIKLLMAQTEPAGTAALEANATASFKTIDAASKRLGSGMRLAGGAAQFSGITQDFGYLQDLILGPDGLFVHQRDFLAAQGYVDNGKAALDRIDRVYLETLPA